LHHAIDVLALFILAIWLGEYKVAMSQAIYPLAFLDFSIRPDESASPVLLAILEVALVDLTSHTDEEAFAVRCLSACEHLADVFAFIPARDVDVWDDEPLEVFRLDELRSLTVVKDAYFVY